MDFTALHRALGEQPGALTSEMLDRAVEMGLTERDDLDWKRQLPAQKDLADSDLAKDVVAMANGGGGVIVFGVVESQKAANPKEPCSCAGRELRPDDAARGRR